MKKQLPNIITLLNLLCGVLSIVVMTVYHNMTMAALLIVLGAVFDFFDGMTARLFKMSSPIGKELDSLSDIVTFGVAPAIMTSLILIEQKQDFSFLSILGGIICFVPIIMAILSSYRLAKFNLDKRQSSAFIGLATPANAFFWLSIPIIKFVYENNTNLWSFKHFCIYDNIYSILLCPYVILPLSIIMAIILISEIPMFSLKFHDFKWQSNKIRFIFLIISATLIILINVYALPIIIIFYIILSIVDNQIKKQ